MKETGLSKSKIILGLQCEKALYLNVYNPELAEKISDAQQMIFDQGTKVGILAQKHFPDGILVDAPYYNSKLALEQTHAAIEAGAKNIYEATFAYDGVLVKVDILTRSGVTSEWEIVEVKSTTEVKNVHLRDAAIQMWVLRNAGLRVKSASILHINNKCVFPNLSNLFARVDVTKQAQTLQKELPIAVAKFQELLGKPSQPDKDIGPHCDDPYECAFKNHCWSEKHIPKLSIFDIPRLSAKKKWELYKKGPVSLESIDSTPYNAIQRRMIDVTVSQNRFVNRSEIKKELQEWKYPLSFLDFETIAYAIPRYKSIRPYQQLPFQFSCHIQTTEEHKLTHFEYLHVADTDPRDSIAAALVEMIPTVGSVVAYNMGFEKQVLLALSNERPSLRDRLRGIAARLVDPLTIFRNHVYDPGFNGSFSIKNVAPAILGQSASYNGMLVGDGSQAQVAFLELIASGTPTDRKKALEKGLLEYCQKDTMGMVELVWWLQEQ